MKKITTQELINELIERGAKLIENKLYQDDEVCVCKNKYSHNTDVKVLDRVLDISSVDLP